MSQTRASHEITLTHTTHIANLPAILRDGGVCCPDGRDGAYREIWSADIVERRATQVVDAASELRLGGCVGLTLTSRTPALYAVATGYGVPRVINKDILHLETIVPVVEQQLFVADRNPLARDVRIVAGTAGFDGVDWDVIVSGDFTKTANDPTRPARVAAEALVRAVLPLAAVQRIVCSDPTVALTVTGFLHDAAMTIPVEVRPKAFFSAGR